LDQVASLPGLRSHDSPQTWQGLRPLSFHKEKHMAKKPVRITKQLMMQIADRLAVGETLNKMVEEPGMPTYQGIMQAVLRDDELYEIYRQGRVLQAEYYLDHINTVALSKLPDDLDSKDKNAEVQRRRLEIDTLKWTSSRNQPWGIRDKKEDAPQQQTITVSWAPDGAVIG